MSTVHLDTQQPSHPDTIPRYLIQILRYCLSAIHLLSFRSHRLRRLNPPDPTPSELSKFTRHVSDSTRASALGTSSDGRRHARGLTNGIIQIAKSLHRLPGV
jgi:hypothetical protein